MERDRLVLEIYEQLLDLEQRLIPVGLHVFGQAPEGRELVDTLVTVAAFDRPEAGIRSLSNLVAEALGLPDYSTLVRDSANSAERLEQREQVEAAVRDAIEQLLKSGLEEAAQCLARDAGVPRSQAIVTL